MIQLADKLVALDNEASESLRVISYFDALVMRRAGIGGLLRGAVTLAGAAAGVSDGTVAGTCRVTQGGATSASGSVPYKSWPNRQVSDDSGSWVWIERSGPERLCDAMILDRLALALAITRARTSKGASRHPVEILIDEVSSVTRREAAAARLGLDARGTAVVTVAPATGEVTWDAVVVATDVGRVRVGVNVEQLPGRAGIGRRTPVLDLAGSWSSAVTALRLTSEFQPVLSAEDLGPVLQLVRVGEDFTDADLLGLVIDSKPWALRTLDALIATDSIRGAAALLHFHHSTVQSRTSELSTALGFDIRSPTGRTRLAVLLWLHRLAHTRF